jgi:hypothetical protein
MGVFQSHLRGVESGSIEERMDRDRVQCDKMKSHALVYFTALLALTVSACASRQDPVQTGPDETVSTESSDTRDASTVSVESSGETSGETSIHESTDGMDGGAAESEDAGWQDSGPSADVTYTDRFETEIQGVRFVTTARPTAIRNSWGLEITVTASSADGAEHQIGDGIHLEGDIRGGATSHGFGEGRGDSTPVTLRPGASGQRRMTRRYPSPGTQWVPIAPGETLVLRVGSWAFDQSSGTRHPDVMVAIVVMEVPARGRPRVVVTPPRGTMRNVP